MRVVPSSVRCSSILDLAIVLRRYGFFGLDVDDAGESVTSRLRVTKTIPDQISCKDVLTVVLAGDPDSQGFDGLHAQIEHPGSFLYEPRKHWFLSPTAAYRPLLDYVSFSGNSLTPLLVTANGRAVIGWWVCEGYRYLVIGLRVVDEIVRYSQGDPDKVITAKDKTLWGFGHERPAYLFEDNIVRGHELVPWADRLGFFLAQLFSVASGLPLIELLPGGVKGGILLTGDDDQAALEKYDEQLRLLEGFPITYVMLPHTKHTQETLGQMPPSVEYGVHIDALAKPDCYNSICKDQTSAVRELVRSPARAVRNHGHLNQGYWGHLSAWEECGLVFDLSIRGLDGTCPTGSYLPFRVRRLDGTWSSHVSLFSTFSDSMLYLQKWSQAKQIKCIRKLARQIHRTIPGVIVLNLHPQNVSDFHDVHRAVIALGRKVGWVALGAESYINWQTDIDSIRLVETETGIQLRSALSIDKLAYSWWDREKKYMQVLPRWSDSVTLKQAPF